jgi:DNA polymerase (family 10)
MKLEEAKTIADSFISEIKEFCERIEIAGSIRRNKIEVNDIDIILIPKLREHLIQRIRKISRVEVQGKKLMRTEYSNVQVDVYFATEETWGILLLVRTGSKEHNIKLCQHAINKGMKLSSEKGLMKDGKVIASRTEEEIFQAFGMDHINPEDRN